jgi:hypothetical protein
MHPPFGARQDTRSLACYGITWERISPAPDAPFPAARTARHFFNPGVRTWSVIVRNQPNPGTDQFFAAAIPIGTPSPEAGEQKTYDFAIVAKTQFGGRALRVGYSLVVQAGTTVSGHTASSAPGPPVQWIKRVDIVPAEVSVAWGWSFGMSVVVSDPLEYADGLSPAPVLPIQLDVVLDTAAKQFRESRTHVVCPKGVYVVA